MLASSPRHPFAIIAARLAHLGLGLLSYLLVTAHLSTISVHCSTRLVERRPPSRLLDLIRSPTDLSAPHSLQLRLKARYDDAKHVDFDGVFSDKRVAKRDETHLSIRLLVPKEYEAIIKNKKNLPKHFLQKQLLMQSKYMNTNNNNNNNNLNPVASASSDPSSRSSGSSVRSNFSQLVLRLTRKQFDDLCDMLNKLREQKKINAEEYKHLQRTMFSFGRKK
jgi:hypothetical protein